jgi:hypothetical protein
MCVAFSLVGRGMRFREPEDQTRLAYDPLCCLSRRTEGFFAVFCLVAAPYTGDAALTWLPLASMSATAIILHVVYDLNQKGRKRKVAAFYSYRRGEQPEVLTPLSWASARIYYTARKPGFLLPLWAEVHEPT